MVRVERYVVKIGKFGAYFFDQDLQKDMSLDEVAQLLNKNAEPAKVTVATHIPFESIESDGMPLQPVLEEAQTMTKTIPTIEGAQLPGLAFR